MSDLTLTVHTAPTHTMLDGKSTFSPTTATVIAGDDDAILVDTLYLREDVDALAEAIAGSGRRLTTIFITHGHADHYFGLPRLLARFPEARAVAAPAVAAYIRDTVAHEAEAFGRFFAELAVAPDVLPEALDGDSIELEGHTLRVVDVGQADIAPTTALHVPDLGAVIAGDAVYNGIHAMLALGGPEQWSRWLEGIDRIAALNATVVVAGHKEPDAPDDARPQIEETRRYIEDFTALVADGRPTRAIVEAMTERWPEHGNVTTLITSARAAAHAARSDAS